MKRIWIDKGVLTPNDLKKIQEKMNQFKILADLGRIPGNIERGEGFSNYTADQWRIFFMIYATISLWEHLPSKDRKILTHFVRVHQEICLGNNSLSTDPIKTIYSSLESAHQDESNDHFDWISRYVIFQNFTPPPKYYTKLRLNKFPDVCPILVSRILEIELMEEAHERLIKIIKLIEVHYGRVKITPNLHLSLHLCDCSNDFGSLYAFWCFSFERMNGILGSLPISNRQIEPEIMRRIMNDNRIENIINSDIQTKGLELLED
ncbi:unnamed protein product [Rhizophagus irregularis]|nr:unnamed protein product [Rhizophagus irregularis]